MRSMKMSAAGAVAFLLLVPAGAEAYPVKYSWQGNDRSYNSTDGKTLTVCDGEDDGNLAEGQRWTSSGTRDVVRDDATGGCSSLTMSTVMYRHRVVELRLLDDKVGTMQYLW